uniref:Uncharacterized protein n=1 Tax=Arundo donax TaxID=35708 RepID=A0A0A9G1G8_ARUDO
MTLPNPGPFLLLTVSTSLRVVPDASTSLGSGLTVASQACPLPNSLLPQPKKAFRFSHKYSTSRERKEKNRGREARGIHSCSPGSEISCPRQWN